MASNYNVIGVVTKSYINEAGQVVNGYAVTFRILPFREVHTLNMPNIAKATVQAAIEAFLKDRTDISTL